MPRRKTTQVLKRGRTTWTNIRSVQDDALHEIAGKLRIADHHLGAIMQANHRSRLLVGKNYVALLFIYPTLNSREDIVTQEIDIILTPSQLVTVQHETSRVTQNLFKEIEIVKRSAYMQHPAVLFAELMNRFIRGVYTTLDEIAAHLDRLEREIFGKRRALLEDIIHVQTNILDVRKTLEAQRVLLDRLTDALDPKVEKQLRPTFEDLEKQLTEIQISLQMEQMTAEALHQTRETFLNTRTGKLVNLLTVMSILFLPGTLIAGIFGMNTRFPWILGTPEDFGKIMVLIAATALVLLIVMHRMLRK